MSQIYSVHLTIGLKQGNMLSTMFFNLFITHLRMLLEKHSTQSEESESPELFNTQISSLLTILPH